MDPLNNSEATIVDSSGTSYLVSNMGYGFVLNYGDWILCSFLEAKANADKLVADGGIQDDVYEVGPGVGSAGVICTPGS